jgi:hypothetical protein
VLTGDPQIYYDVYNPTTNHWNGVVPACDLKNVVRIENTSPYEDSISGKGADFSSQTIRALKRGRDDASKVLKS